MIGIPNVDDLDIHDMDSPSLRWEVSSVEDCPYSSRHEARGSRLKTNGTPRMQHDIQAHNVPESVDFAG
jgi:hypothetical protein